MLLPSRSVTRCPHRGAPAARASRLPPGGSIWPSVSAATARKTRLPQIPRAYAKAYQSIWTSKRFSSYQMAAPAAQSFVDRDLPETGHGFDYDLFVIGGGSGGLACAKEAANLGKKVGLADFVTPSPQGSTWGLGGTCVNVGCIPKKLFHNAALLGEGMEDAKHYGWQVPEKKHNWDTLVQAVQDHIGSLNWGYRLQLQDKKVEYLNSLAKLVAPHTIELVNKKKEVKKVTARRVVIAVGGRPRYLNIPGAEHCLTSDDIFSRFEPPGKTLVVGASYVALECAGFLTGLGYDTTVMVRSILLRGFDQQIAEQIGAYMMNHGTKFVRPAEPTKIEKLDSGKLKVFWGEDKSDEFDTVLMAIGRDALTKTIGLDTVGVKTNPSNHKILTTHDQTATPYIYAIGDVIEGPELTPVAIKAGRLLARRIFANGSLLMNYRNVPTTVFTPLEYGACGYSEEDALAKFGKNNIEVFHAYFKPLEFTVAERPENECYVKLIVNKADKERVLGLHILGPHAGEVTQGYGVAIQMGATKADLDITVGIHPTVAEELIEMDITKASGRSAEKTGC